MDEDYEDWSIQDLRDRVRLVQELDALADEMVQQAVQMAMDYSVEEVEILGSPRFLQASLLAELRRRLLSGLEQKREERPFVHDIRPESLAPRHPKRALTAEENVTNRLAEAFYRDHGVEQIARGLDLAPSTLGQRVMRSPYCIRREIGQCLKKNPTLKGELYIEHGAFRYRLHFDCKRCEMSLIHENRR